MPRNQQVIRQWKILRRLEQSPSGINVSELAKEEIAEEEGFKSRNIYRDFKALQAAGFPIYNIEEDGQAWWRLTEGYRKSGGVPLSLSEILALRCARGALESIKGTPFAEGLCDLISKLDTLLSPAMLEFAQQMDDAIVGDYFGRPDYTGLKPIIEKINQAIAGKITLEIQHCSQHGNETIRKLDPYNLWLHRNVLYLIGWCHLRNEIRTFSLARIHEVTLTEENFEPQPDYDFHSFSQQRFRIMSEGHIQKVRIWFAPEAAIYIKERVWHPTQTITPSPGGGVELTMEVDGMSELCTWVLSFGPRAKVIEPEELKQKVRSEIAGAARHYAE